MKSCIICNSHHKLLDRQNRKMRYDILFEKHEGKVLLAIPRHGWKDNIKTNLKRMIQGSGLD